MMKTKHISLSIALLMMTNIVFGQYAGGSGDGSTEYMIPLSYLNGSRITDIFGGGDADGFSVNGNSLSYLDGAPAFTYLMGGDGDGATVYASKDNYVDGTSLGDSYGGGDGDGTNSDIVGAQFLEGSLLNAVYQGGMGDGSDQDTISLRFLDGETGCSIYKLEAGTADTIINGAYDQDIIVYYAFEPFIGELVVNNLNFPITGSPQTITLPGLAADGMPVDVTASFTSLPDCEIQEFALFFAQDTNSTSIYTELGVPQIEFSSRPNPFSSQITFSVQMENPEFVSMDLLTLSGQKVATVFEGKIHGKEVREITYNAYNLPQGMYLCRLRANGHVYYQKLVKLK